MKKFFSPTNPLVRLINNYTTGLPFVIWGLYGLAMALFLFIFRNQPFVRFGNLIYVIAFSTFWFLVSDITKKRELFPKRLHFLADSLAYLSVFSLILYFTGGFRGDLFFIFSLVAISAPLFGSAIDTIALIVLVGIASFGVNAILARQGMTEFDSYHIGVLFLVWLIYFAIAGIIKYFQSNYLREAENIKEYQETLLEKNKELEKAKTEVENQIREQTKKLQKQNVFLEDTRKAVLNILEDVAESEQNIRKANILIEQQKERVESVLQFLKSIGDGVVATDLSKKIIFFNKAAEKITGVPSSEAMGKYAHDVLFIFSEGEKGSQTRRFIFKEIFENKGGLNRESNRFIIKRKDGSQLPVAFSASLIYDIHREKQGGILVLRDITEERKLEKIKDKFLSVAAHQLRTPLSGIRWSLEMLLEGDVGKLPKEAEEVVKNISDNNLRLVGLVNDLLDVSRIDLNKITEPVKSTDVVKTILSVLESAKGFADKNRIEVIFDKEKSAGFRVLIGPQRFFESIENLLFNAIKYTPEGGTVKVSVSKNGDLVEIAVADTGIGIPKKEQEKIFSRFFRAENAIQKEPDGSGLGLSVVKSFIEEAGGKVSFKSVEDKGTTFYVTLPIDKEII